MFIKANKISYVQAKQLFGQKLKIRLLGFNTEYEATVVDYCFEDQTGLILSMPPFEKNLEEFFKSLIKENGSFLIDARNIFDGNLIEVDFPTLH